MATTKILRFCLLLGVPSATGVTGSLLAQGQSAHPSWNSVIVHRSALSSRIAGSQLDIRLQDAAGTKIESGKISVLVRGHRAGRDTTYADLPIGVSRVTGLPAGRFEIWARAVGYRPFHPTVSVGPRERLRITLVLERDTSNFQETIPD